MGILNIIPLFADKKCLNVGKMMTYDIEAAEKDIHDFEDEMFKHKLSTASLKTGSSHAVTKTHLVFDRVWLSRRWQCTEKIINFLVAVNYVDDHDTIKIFEIPHDSYLNYRMRSFRSMNNVWCLALKLESPSVDYCAIMFNGRGFSMVQGFETSKTFSKLSSIDAISTLWQVTDNRQLQRWSAYGDNAGNIKLQVVSFNLII